MVWIQDRFARVCPWQYPTNRKKWNQNRNQLLFLDLEPMAFARKQSDESTVEVKGFALFLQVPSEFVCGNSGVAAAAAGQRIDPEGRLLTARSSRHPIA